MPRLMSCALIAFMLSFVGAHAGDSGAGKDNEILLIFNHGSSKHHNQDCYWPLNPRPYWLRRIDGARIGQRTLKVVTPCTGDQSGTFPQDECGDIWVCNRANEIVKAIERYRAKGYPPENIFVGGHSAGGWASLLIKRWNPSLFNGVIATAPAFNGKRRNRLCLNTRCDGSDVNSHEKRRHLNSILRQMHDEELASGPRLRALVFAFQCDPFGHPDEYGFAGNDVSLISMPHWMRQSKCAIPSTRYRHFEGTGAGNERCEPADPGTYSDQPGGPVCGGGDDDAKDRHWGQILNCLPSQASYCRMNQHTKAHRSPQFYRMMRSGKVVIDFIEARMNDNWHSANLDVGGTPCGFVKYPDQCTRR